MSLDSIKKLFFLILFIPLCIYSQDNVHIIIDRLRDGIQVGNRINLGISKFISIEPDIKHIETANKIQDVTRQDLLFTKYFNPVESKIYFKSEKDALKFWYEKIAVQVYLWAVIKIKDNQCVLEAKLYNVSDGNLIFQKSFSDKVENYRYIAHCLSDEIVEVLTGEKGIAKSKIVFSNNSTGYKEIYIVDYDGYNLKRLTDDRSINILPRWSHDNKKIIYTSYKRHNPDIFIMNADGTDKKPLLTNQGLNTPASFSPDGKFIVASLSLGKSPNIYLLSDKGEIVRAITYGESINTSPVFSPDGNQIVFVSGRAGIPQMYITDIYGTNTRRLSTEGYADSPSWSPRGNIIAFAMRVPYGDYFDIYLYDIGLQAYYPITFSSRSNETPSFSPDGRFIVFSSNRNNRYELFIVFIDGTGERRLGDIKGNSFFPNWSR